MSAALLVLALMLAATVSERGLAQRGLGPCRSDAMLSVPIENVEEVTVIFMTAETMCWQFTGIASWGLLFHVALRVGGA